MIGRYLSDRLDPQSRIYSIVVVNRKVVCEAGGDFHFQACSYDAPFQIVDSVVVLHRNEDVPYVQTAQCSSLVHSRLSGENAFVHSSLSQRECTSRLAMHLKDRFTHRRN